MVVHIVSPAELMPAVVSATATLASAASAKAAEFLRELKTLLEEPGLAL